MNRCKHGTYVGDWAGPDYICGDCEEGLCQHGQKTSGFCWEDTEACEQCGVSAKPRLFPNFEASARDAQARTMVRMNQQMSRAEVQAALVRNFGMTDEEAETYVRLETAPELR